MGLAQVRNKWLRILETSGGRSANITGANTAAQPAGSADGRGSGGQANHNSFANGRGRGRGGFSRGGQRGGGGSRGGSRVIPRQPTPPAMVNLLFCYTHYMSIMYDLTASSFDTGLTPLHVAFHTDSKQIHTLVDIF
jgi:hypothetical protein